MSTIKNCKNCIWFDQCHEDEACDSYEPASLEEQEAMDIEVYEEDLRMRHAYYMEQVAEQDE